MLHILGYMLQAWNPIEKSDDFWKEKSKCGCQKNPKEHIILAILEKNPSG
jgi:hypothetical protein